LLTKRGGDSIEHQGKLEKTKQRRNFCHQGGMALPPNSRRIETAYFQKEILQRKFKSIRKKKILQRERHFGDLLVDRQGR